jgi:hypothetical protein
VFIASTSEVYGKSHDIPYREDGDLTLGATLPGRWSYACSKAIDELLAIAYWKSARFQPPSDTRPAHDFAADREWLRALTLTGQRSRRPVDKPRWLERQRGFVLLDNEESRNCSPGIHQ